MLRNAGFLLMTEVITRLAALALAVAIARGVGSAGYGHYTYALAFAGTFAAFADFGVSRLLTRSVAAQRDAAAPLISTALAARSILLLLALAAALAVTHWQPADQQALLVLLLAVAASQSIAGLWRSIFFGFERMQLDTASRLLERLLAVSGAFLALGKGFGLVGVAVAFLFAGLVDVVVVTALVVTRLARPSRSVSTLAVRKLLHDALPLGLFGLVLTLQSYAPLFFLTALRGASSTGHYSAGATPILALIPIPVLAAGAAFPMLSRLAASDKAAFQRASSLLLRIFGIVGLAAAPGMVIVAAPLIDLVYGPGFAGSAPALRILAIGILGMFPTQVCVNILVAAGRQRAVLRGDVIALVWQVTVDALAIPHFGLIGAAVGTASAELVLGALLLSSARRATGGLRLLRLLRALPAAAAMSVVALLFVRAGLLAPAILVGAFSYGALLVVFRPLSLLEAQDAWRLFGRQPSGG